MTLGSELGFGRSVAWPEPTRTARSIDPRLFQIATLSGLLAFGVIRLGLELGPVQIATSLAAALGAQAAGSRIAGLRFDPLSATITGLSLALLLRSNHPIIWAAAPAIAIGGKFCLRIRGKHLFNPACLAIVTLLLTTGMVWVSPGQWGTLGWAAVAVACAASLVLGAARRIDIAVAFLVSWTALLAWRCWNLGDPWTIPLHQVQSGSLLIFGCFMITDPRSTPDGRLARMLFALAVAATGYVLQFQFQIREGLFYALIAVSLTTPLLDLVLPGGTRPRRLLDRPLHPPVGATRCAC